MKISIITICLNSEKTIRKTIESVLKQKDDDVEYIIIDGKSSDNTLEIINEYEDQIDLFVSENDAGISDAFNKGITYSSGEYIGIINSDDILVEGAIKYVKKILTENKPDIIYGNCIISRDESMNDGYLFIPVGPNKKLRLFFTLCHPATLIAKSAYNKFGLYNLDYKFAMDFELISKMYLAGASFSYVDYPIAFFREGGVSKKNYIHTIKESVLIAKRNGCNLVHVYIFYIWILLKQVIFTKLKRTKKYLLLRQIIKKQKAINKL